MGHATVSLRELRDGEKQLTLESRGNPKEEVKGAILISGSTGSSDGMRGSFLGRSAGRVLMDSTISADTVGMLSVHKAAYAGDVEWLNKLLSEKKASSVVQAKCRMSGWVALEYAVHGDRVEAAKAILAVSTECCENVLHLVRSEEMAGLLLAAGFRPSSANRLGQTSLVSVAQRGGSRSSLLCVPGVSTWCRLSSKRAASGSGPLRSRKHSRSSWRSNLPSPQTCRPHYEKRL